MCRRIVVTSGKGGVGKTTVCANLGYALARLDNKVLLIDVDFGLNNLDVVLGVENKIVYDVIDVISGKCRPTQALIQDFFVNNLYVLPSNHTYCKQIDDEKLKEVIDELSEQFDYVLIDCPAGIDAGFYRSVLCADEAILVTTPHISSVRDGDKVLTMLTNTHVNLTQLVVNRARGDLMLNGEMIDVTTIKEYLNIPLLGVVPEDDSISCQLLTSGELNINSDAYVAYTMLACRLNDGKSEVFDCTRKYKGVLGGLRRKVRRIVWKIYNWWEPIGLKMC